MDYPDQAPFPGKVNWFIICIDSGHPAIKVRTATASSTTAKRSQAINEVAITQKFTTAGSGVECITTASCLIAAKRPVAGYTSSSWITVAKESHLH